MDQALRHRVNAGRTALKAQVDFFRSQFGQVPSEWKADDTRVTFADFAISERIFTDIRRSFPDDNFCSEESSPSDEVLDLKSARHTWVLDPIDGTNNYAQAIPFCAISLALLRDGEPVYGLLYDLSRDRLVQGGPGEGLFEGCRKIVPAEVPFTQREGLVGAHFPFPAKHLDTLAPLMSTYRLRTLGSGALNITYTALGIFDGVFDFKVKIWDIAAGLAFLKAVGYEVIFLAEDPFPMKTFHVDAPLLPYVAGSPDFMRWWKKEISMTNDQ